MVFVTADRCRMQLEQLTRHLVAAFPGCTIYQHTDVMRVPHDVLNHKVDAIVLTAGEDSANDLDLIKMLRRQKPDVPVFLRTGNQTGCDAEEAGVNGCFALADGEQPLLDAIRQMADEEANPTDGSRS